MSEDKKLTLSTNTLSVGKGGDTGNVRQSFSHGRSKAVVVERKKKRILTKGATPDKVTKPIVPKTQTFKVKKPVGEVVGEDTTLTNTELETRVAALESAKKADIEKKKLLEAEADRKAQEQERKKAEAEERRKKEAAEAAIREEMGISKEDIEAEAAEKAEQEAALLAAEAAKKAANEKLRKKEEAEAEKKAEADAHALEMRRVAEAAKIAESQVAAVKEEEGVGRKKNKKTAKKQVEHEGRPHNPKNESRRRFGKLSVTSNFDDDGVRTRSLAAIKRAQAKAKRAAGGQEDNQKRSREVIIPEAITVKDLADRMAEKSNVVIKTLMGLDMMVTINEILDQDTAQLVVEELGHTVKRVSEADVEVGVVGEVDKEEDLKPRSPVVTVMGHVDHGKTSLLDALRKTSVVKGEAGGITQHIGAYQVVMKDGHKITFLDTPGHAAFTEMRARGASVTDIVVLVVAADDGIMPQTIEAINHAKAANVPMIVAINKIDRPGANADGIRQELLQHEVIVEAFNGETQDVEVSALKGTNLDKLVEAIYLQAELLELKANPDRDAEGVVVEAKLDKGRGSVATVLVQRGTLRVGDIIVAGGEWGKVRAIVSDQGERIEEAGPSVPVEVLGLNGTPSAGDDFASVKNESRARQVTSYRQDLVKKKAAAALGPKTLESMFTQLKESERVVFPVVIKADVHGSVEAITSALQNIGNDDIQVRILHAAVGGITESDITLANASGALVIGFNVRPNKQARDASERDGVVIKYYSIIYELMDDVRAGMAGQLGPEYKENIIGRARIKDVFSAGKTGKAAGCMVEDGSIRRDCLTRILRDDVIIYNGAITNLRRFKDDVNKVDSGQECGLTFENFNDMKPNDMLEVYELQEVERVI